MIFASPTRSRLKLPNDRRPLAKNTDMIQHETRRRVPPSGAVRLRQAADQADARSAPDRDKLFFEEFTQEQRPAISKSCAPWPPQNQSAAARRAVHLWCSDETARPFHSWDGKLSRPRSSAILFRRSAPQSQPSSPQRKPAAFEITASPGLRSLRWQ